MSDIIIVIIIMFIISAAIISIVNKQKNQSSCCSSSTYKAKSRKIKNIVYNQSFIVEDMHCNNCVNRIIETIQDLDGTSCHVLLNKKIVNVKAEYSISDQEIIDLLDKKGYKAKVYE